MELPLLSLSLLVALLAVPSAHAGDPAMLQDVCVADLKSAVKVNGFVCKDIANVTEMDFFSNILATPGDTNNNVGSRVTAANVNAVPGLNTLGVSMSRIDYAPYGLNPPHTHPRATEMAFVMEGEIYMGFITTANRLFAKTVKKGETFVFPRGLVHFQMNIANVPAVAIVAFDSQLPGTQTIATTLFGASPAPGVPNQVLAKAFQIGDDVVAAIKAKFAT